ncbi:MAG: TonB-dependent receptor [Candidatus Didemnitutus sp.]|nr:TonB-dependent receptor [Candidatus Didemnitutus sp.]
MKLHLRTPFLAGFTLACTAVASWAQTAPATTPPPSPDREGEVVKLDTFTVTGTNIRRIDEETTLPVTVLDADDLAAFAAPTPSELLSMLPSGGVITLGESNVLGADARGDNTSLNLRGIGSGNTLVLVNGRRLAPHPVSQAEGGVPSLAVNVNQLPNAAIERVEVLREGASAIYGADAAAGVVNTIIRKDYQGWEVKMRGSVTEHGGANDWRVTVTSGDFYNAGRTHVTAMLDFYHRDFLGTKDRHFSSQSDIRKTANLPEPWSTTDSDFDNSSSASNFGNFIRGSFDANNNFVGARPTSNRGISTTSLTFAGGAPNMTLTSGGAFFIVPNTGAAIGVAAKQTTPSRTAGSVENDYYYNLNQHRTILPATDRLNFFTQIDHEINDRLSAFAEIAYYRADSTGTRDPQGTDGTDDFNLYVGIDNPYNPFGSRFYHPTGLANTDGTPRITGTPAAVMIAGSTGVRPREFKERSINVLSQSFRGVAGLRGKTFADFEWESGMMYSRAWTRDEESFNVRHSLLQDALLRTDATAFNPFGYTFKLTPNPGGVTGGGTAVSNPYLIQIDKAYTNPDSVVDPLYDTFIREGRTELATWDGKINGTLFDLWGGGGRVAAALGAEYRWESYSDWRPPYHGLNPDGFLVNAPGFPAVDNDFVGLSPNRNLYSDRDVMSTYGELLFPIVSRKNRLPLVQALEVGVAGRYEKFSDFGDAFKPKYSVAWRPTGNLLFRASYNESFRAPNLVQTNTSPLQRSVSGVSDPYRFTVTNVITDGSVSRTVFRQGNDQLDPEESRIATVGFAFEVPKIKGLTFTADWWRIDQNKVIDNLTASGQLTRDRDLLDVLSRAAMDAGIDVNTIDVGSGTAGYLGNTKVNRAPLTAADLLAFSTYNAANPGSQRIPVGRVLSVVDDYINLSGRDIEGIDMALSYRSPRFSFGQFTIRGSATYTTKFLEKLDEFSEPDSVLQEDGRAKLRANGSLTWRIGKWTAGWSSEYYGGSMDPGAALATGATGQALYEALGSPSYIKVFHDIGGVVRYRWWIEDTWQHNVYLQHRFGRQKDIHNNVTVRFGITNVFDEEPPLADESRGYQGGTVSAKGRTFYIDITKKL